MKLLASKTSPYARKVRILVKRWEALSDGHMDAAIGARNEGKRAKRIHSQESLARPLGKMSAAVDAMSRDLGDRLSCNGETHSPADIATGAALGYLDFRHPGFAWRDSAPNLARLLQKLAKRPSFESTVPA